MRGMPTVWPRLVISLEGVLREPQMMRSDEIDGWLVQVEVEQWIVDIIRRLADEPPGAQAELSRHVNLRAAQRAISSHRRTRRWGGLPIAMRAVRVPPIEWDARPAAIFLTLSDTPFGMEEQ